MLRGETTRSSCSMRTEMSLSLYLSFLQSEIDGVIHMSDLDHRGVIEALLWTYGVVTLIWTRDDIFTDHLLTNTHSYRIAGTTPHGSDCHMPQCDPVPRASTIKHIITKSVPIPETNGTKCDFESRLKTLTAIETHLQYGFTSKSELSFESEPGLMSFRPGAESTFSGL